MFKLNNFKVVFLFILATIFFSCNDNYVSSIPSYPVNLQLNLTSTYPNFKNSWNQFLIFDKRIFESDRIGYGGILIYSGGLDDSGNTAYFAFDMACPYEAQSKVRVYPVEDSLGEVKCEKCGSVYDVSFGFGNPTSGPSTEILRKYKTTITNDVLYVYQ